MRWVALLFLVFPAQLASQTKPQFRSPALNLLASVAKPLTANRVYVGVSNAGYIGAFLSQPGVTWPAPYVQQLYVFYSGLQVAGLIPRTAGFTWAGDTVAVYFADERGDQVNGGPLADVFDSRDSADAARWPQSAIVLDTAVYTPSLIGKPAVSAQDLWTRYWDRPRLVPGLTHPMGLLVDQRFIGWPYPTGNADVVYMVYTLYNVTARTPAAYNNPTIPFELRGAIATEGRAFQDTVETSLGVQLPDAGYALDSVYIGLLVDHDIATFNHNYATASVPFGLAIGYDGHFRDELGWTYPPEIFGAPPFTPVPGLLGAKFLKAPGPFVMFTNFTGGGTFPDPIGAPLLWRRMSLNLVPSDAQCNPFTNPAVARQRHLCTLVQTQSDSRFQISAGPFHLGPGEATTVILAFLLAAPLDTVNAYVGGDLRPGVPFTGDSIAVDTTKITTIERAAGWRTQTDLNGDGVIQAAEVTAVRRSLLHKAQVAQAIVDAKFLMAAAPDAPEFFLIPGDNAVTVVWQPSATEKSGDPYYPLAADSNSALYDPNYRRLDVEGYRIYRGRTPNALELLAQVDYDNTEFVDYTGAILYPGRCAPELGIVADCPVRFPPTPSATVSTRQPIAGTIVQVPEGARILTTSGALAVVRTDTFPTGFPPLAETGVTFSFTDLGVRNSFRYYYSVTAFDLNSIRSGPSSFESPRFVKAVMPRAPSGQESAGQFTTQLLGGDGTALDTTAPLPTIAAATGVFSGPMPPTNGFHLTFAALLPELLGAGRLTVRIDSVQPGIAGVASVPPGGRPARYFVAAASPTDTVHFVVPLYTNTFTVEMGNTVRFAAVAADSAQAARFGIAPKVSIYGEVTLKTTGRYQLASWGEAGLFWFPQFSFDGPRWWTGSTNETTPNPNGGNCAPPTFSCGSAIRVPNIGLTAGGIAGVTIFHPQGYSSTPSFPLPMLEQVTATVTRAADFRVVWGAGGAIDTVLDETHHVLVPFNTTIGPTWGVLTEESFAAVDPALTRDGKNDLLTWADLFCVGPLPQYIDSLRPTGDTTKADCGGPAQTPAILRPSATLSPIAIRDTASSYSATATAGYTATGNGFILYLNGHFFLMQMTSPPAAGTVWHARFYSGTIKGSAAQANFTFEAATRPPAVPGLRAELTFQGSRFNRLTTADSLLARVHTVPDPFYVASGFESSLDTLTLKFVHLPALAIVRIYSQSGILVQALTNDDPTGGGELTWDLRSRSGKRIASGVYFYHVETPDHRKRIGRFTVISGHRIR